MSPFDQVFMSTAMIDSSPNERAGVGVYNGFRERDKSKEI